MVLNDIIEQAAGRQSRASDHGGKFYIKKKTHRPNHTMYIVRHAVKRTLDEINFKSSTINSETYRICVLC